MDNVHHPASPSLPSPGGSAVVYSRLLGEANRAGGMDNHTIATGERLPRSDQRQLQHHHVERDGGHLGGLGKHGESEALVGQDRLRTPHDDLKHRKESSGVVSKRTRWSEAPIEQFSQRSSLGSHEEYYDKMWKRLQQASGWHASLSLICYTGAMTVCMILEILMVLIVYLVNPYYFGNSTGGYHEKDQERKVHSRKHEDADLIITLCACIQCVVCGMVFFATIQIARDFRTSFSEPSNMFKVFFATLTAFAGIYFLISVTDQSSLVRTGIDQDVSESADVLIMGIRCLYFSTATITSVGFGDVVARHWAAVTVSSIEMILGMSYTVGFFVICLHQFREREHFLALSGKQQRRGIVSKCFKWIRDNVPGAECARKIVIRFLLLVSLAVEIIAVSIFMSHGSNPFQQGAEKDVTLIAVSITIQLMELFLILLVSMRLVQKAKSHEVSVSFLLQSFFSTAILFAGVYFTLLLINSNAFRYYSQNRKKDGVFKVAGELMYFSITVMTTTGYGDIYPATWYAQLAVCIQMVVAFIYTVVIIGLGMVHVIELLPSTISRRATQASLAFRKKNRLHSRGTSLRAPANLDTGDDALFSNRSPNNDL
eukprot:CAMPEP_0114493848 /NCGR_PEP_ID=MMETSP0109-20121206/4329_1 /TAXON_ID=29199 /ORGANISM="Chlorarachnion reptans, Strain CCCM449" /LENGTH=598 /DNA_ID=CAMNT_0001670829 /DNA_START=236 /DNA_END=2032 /DNA_ORIENTATION=+